MGDSLGLASLLRDFVDVLIPGEGPWPSASMVGVQGVLAMRLLEAQGETGADELERALLACGGPLAPLDAEARAAVVRQFEAAEPALFKLVRNAAYLAYYEHPAVVRAIQGLGQPYQAMPGAKGYPLPAFDLEHDRPRHGRGHYIRTEDVKPLDLGALAEGEHGRT